MLLVGGARSPRRIALAAEACRTAAAPRRRRAAPARAGRVGGADARPRDERDLPGRRPGVRDEAAGGGAGGGGGPAAACRGGDAPAGGGGGTGAAARPARRPAGGGAPGRRAAAACSAATRPRSPRRSPTPRPTAAARSPSPASPAPRSRSSSPAPTSPRSAASPAARAWSRRGGSPTRSRRADPLGARRRRAAGGLQRRPHRRDRRDGVAAEVGKAVSVERPLRPQGTADAIRSRCVVSSHVEGWHRDVLPSFTWKPVVRPLSIPHSLLRRERLVFVDAAAGPTPRTAAALAHRGRAADGYVLGARLHAALREVPPGRARGQAARCSPVLAAGAAPTSRTCRSSGASRARSPRTR